MSHGGNVSFGNLEVGKKEENSISCCEGQNDLGRLAEGRQGERHRDVWKSFTGCCEGWAPPEM